jgi:xanthine dehydrogenase YagS FAD-binding subunit
MHPFAYARPDRADQAVAIGADPGTMFLAGGTELLNWMRLGIVAPERVVDISRITELERIESLAGGALHIGALVKLNDAAQHPAVVRDYPVLSQSILKAASAQLRNLATIGGNLMQRTRCPYFRAEETKSSFSDRCPRRPGRGRGGDCGARP